MFRIRSREFRLRVGDIVISIDTPSAEYAESFEEYFGCRSSRRTPDIHFKLNIIDHDYDIFVPDSMFTHKLVEGESFTFGDDLAHGTFRGDKMRGEIFLKRGMTQIPLTRVFEQILYQVFYSAAKKNISDGFLVHSSGVIYNGKGFLFVGKSGTGKSTVAEISSEYTVLNDEITLVKKMDGMYRLCGTPFNGLFSGKKRGEAELSAVFLLKHGVENRLVETGKSDAVKMIAGEIVPPVGISEKLDSSVYADMLDYSIALCENVPVMVLEFLPDREFWRVIETEFCN